MSNQSIIDAYELQDLTIKPDKLLLDSTNPRIVLKAEGKIEYTDKQLATQEVQNYILSIVDMDDFHVSDLIRGIGRDGFLDHGNRMIVEKIQGTDKYLVLEGNRRTAAIKNLLNSPEDLQPHVLKSLEDVRVQELILKEVDGYTRDEVVFKLLGMIHLSGALEWGAMERAFYIYKSYLFEFDRIYDGSFMYDPSCARACVETFNITLAKVRADLAIYRVFEQLQDEGYSVKEDHYSLISLAVKTRQLNSEYFELDGETFEFSDLGLERFSLLCLDDDCAIHNPGDFKDFAGIYRDGTSYEIELVENGEQSLAVVVERLNNRLARGEFKRELEDIESRLETLTLQAATGSAREVQLIKNIRDLANRVLRSVS
jgi:hypothetical protein